MRRLLLLLALPVALAACSNANAPDVYLNPDFQKRANNGQLVYQKIAVLPFRSTLNHADDPDGVAPATMEKFFIPQINQRRDYNFVSMNTVRAAIEMQGWGKRYENFLAHYEEGDNPDSTFVGELAHVLNVDAFLMPVVDLWQKDEVDVQENATPATYIGASIIILDGVHDPGRVLFRATAEDYEEGARNETGDRTLVTGASGNIQSDPYARVYKAPPFEDVAPRVAKQLVAALPAR